MLELMWFKQEKKLSKFEIMHRNLNLSLNRISQFSTFCFPICIKPRSNKRKNFTKMRVSSIILDCPKLEGFSADLFLILTWILDPLKNVKVS